MATKISSERAEWLCTYCAKTSFPEPLGPSTITEASVVATFFANFNNVKIIAVTVNEEDGVAHYIQDYCFDTYLAKPISKEEMISCLIDILGFSQAPQSEEKIDISDEQFKGLRILVVEDTLLNQRLIQAIFNRYSVPGWPA